MRIGLTLLLGLVGKHGTESDITDSSDTLGRSVELVINNDSSSLVLLDTDCLEVQTFSDRSSTNGDQDGIDVELKSQPRRQMSHESCGD